MHEALKPKDAFAKRLREASIRCAELPVECIEAELTPFWVKAVHDMMSGNTDCPCRTSRGGSCVLEVHADELKAMFHERDISFETFLETFETSRRMLALVDQRSL